MIVMTRITSSCLVRSLCILTIVSAGSLLRSGTNIDMHCKKFCTKQFQSKGPAMVCNWNACNNCNECQIHVTSGAPSTPPSTPPPAPQQQHSTCKTWCGNSFKNRDATNVCAYFNKNNIVNQFQFLDVSNLVLNSLVFRLSNEYDGFT